MRCVSPWRAFGKARQTPNAYPVGYHLNELTRGVGRPLPGFAAGPRGRPSGATGGEWIGRDQFWRQDSRSRLPSFCGFPC